MYNVIDYLENSTKKHKNKIAVIEEDKKLTYSELASFSKSVGTFIASKGLFNEPIMIFMEKGIDTLIAFFGSVYAGCCYSLINPDFPETRITQIKDVLNSRFIITDEDHYELAKEYFSAKNVYVITDLKNTKIDNKLLDSVKNKHIDYDPLYINFTSGSTGVPKGVAICHRSVIDFIDKFTEIFNFNDKDIIANQAPFDFDVSVKDIYSSIKVGATLLIVPTRYFSNPSILLDYLCDNNTTTMTWAVSALCLITTFHGLDYKVPTKVNKILFSGEVMPIKHLNIWMDHLPKTMFVNLYGPTEITCNCTYHIIDRKRDYNDKIPMGYAFPNERVFLLDENNKEVTEKNVTAEVCVSGSCNALGYYNNKEQTAKAFTLNPSINAYNEVIYHTGDLAYYNELGEFVFNGRKDFQIKYLGHRIELEEVDKSIMKCEKVIRCATFFDEEKSKLYAYYSGDIDKKELVIKLKELIPAYMIPTKLIQIDNFPLTKNGKIDRKKLMSMYKEK
ncbi:MAG: amino acid adenylation domain-containing protein [Bacilli bacterium]|nr:amino acid adenylation domain-containing protein [Bacilli bacterium]